MKKYSEMSIFLFNQSYWQGRTDTPIFHRQYSLKDYETPAGLPRQSLEGAILVH